MGSKIVIKPDHLAFELHQIFNSLPMMVENVVSRCAADVAKEAVKQLRATSPVNNGSPRSGQYAKGWATKVEKGKHIVHNKTDYQLTHLLENGHDIIRNGKKVGESPKKQHIKQVEEMVQDMMYEKTMEMLDNI